jgi:signal transduction histidine kinase
MHLCIIVDGVAEVTISGQAHHLETVSAMRHNGSDAHEIHFKVQDTGIGIKPQMMDRLFQPFAQVDETVTCKYGGIGLGLAISRKLVELMG